MAEYKKDYDQTYIDEMVKSYNEANRAWALYRDKECWSGALRDGMNMRYAGAITDACRLSWTKRRVNELRKEITRHSALMPKSALAN